MTSQEYRTENNDCSWKLHNSAMHSGGQTETSNCFGFIHRHSHSTMNVVVNKGVEQSVVIHFLHEIFALGVIFYYNRGEEALVQRSKASAQEMCILREFTYKMSLALQGHENDVVITKLYIIFTHFAARWRRTKT